MQVFMGLLKLPRALGHHGNQLIDVELGVSSILVKGSPLKCVTTLPPRESWEIVSKSARGVAVAALNVVDVLLV